MFGEGQSNTLSMWVKLTFVKGRVLGFGVAKVRGFDFDPVLLFIYIHLFPGNRSHKTVMVGGKDLHHESVAMGFVDGFVACNIER